MKKLFLLLIIPFLFSCIDTKLTKPFQQLSFEIDEMAVINNLSTATLNDSIFQTILYNSRKESFETKENFVEVFVKNYGATFLPLTEIFHTDNPIVFLQNAIQESKKETVKVMRKRLIYKEMAHNVYLDTSSQEIKVEVKTSNEALIHFLVDNADVSIKECLSMEVTKAKLDDLNAQLRDTIPYRFFGNADNVMIGIELNNENYQSDFSTKKSILAKHNNVSTYNLLLNKSGAFSTETNESIMPLLTVEALNYNGIDGRYVLNSNENIDPVSGERILFVTLTKEGANRFRVLTERNLQNHLAIIYKGEIIIAPIVQAPITTGQVQISGLEEKDMKHLNNLLNTGMYPTQVTLVGEEVIE